MFDRIVGHEGVLSLLRKLIENDPCGVFLFHGPKSVGKHTIAREYARWSLCTGTRDKGCVCVNCRLFPNVPDYFSIDDSGEVIKVEDSKSVDKFLSLAPYSSPLRAVVIDDADRMNRQAFCGLLHTLEDCGGRSVVILVSRDESTVPEALVSRCVPIRFGSLSSGEIAEVLSRLGYARCSVEDVCRAMPFFSHSVLTDFKTYLSYMRDAPSLLKSISNGCVDKVLSVANEAVESGRVEHLIESILSCLSDVVKTHYDSPECVANQSMAKEIDELTSVWTPDVCIASMARLGSVLKDARSALHLKIGPRLLCAIGWMSMYVSQAGVRKELV